MNHRNGLLRSACVALLIFLTSCASQSDSGTDLISPRLVELRELEGVSSSIVSGESNTIKVREPILVDDASGIASFSVSAQISEDPRNRVDLIFFGPTSSLDELDAEIDWVRSQTRLKRIIGAARSFVIGAAGSVIALVESLADFVLHPIDTLKGLWTGIPNAFAAIMETTLEEKKKAIEDLCQAYFINTACRIATSHGLNYLTLKTPEAKDLIDSETYARLAGRISGEIALAVAPIIRIRQIQAASAKAQKLLADANRLEQAAGAFRATSTLVPNPKIAALAKGAELLADQVADMKKVAASRQLASVGIESQSVSKCVQSGRLASSVGEFVQFAPEMFSDISRSATQARNIVGRPPSRAASFKRATLGRAASVNYTETFFNKWPELNGKVVVHHAVEQQALVRYPGVITEAQIHSIENLRGIPNALDSTIHKSLIRKEWNEFYRANPANSMTAKKLLDKASDIDARLGHLFLPSVR